MVTKITSKIFWLFIIGLCMPCVSFAFPKKHESIHYIRVAIVQDKETVALSIKGNFKILSSKTGNLLASMNHLDKSDIRIDGSHLSIGDSLIVELPVEIVPETEDTIFINDRRFRGNLRITRDKSNRLLIVNRLDVEDYIKGVLYHEASHFWPQEALKAQAVAVRTYALYQAQINQDKEFDLTADFFTQMYGGRTSEKFRTNKAVELTQGEILTFEGKIFPAYYHATCAGHTEDASNLWNIKLPVLSGVVCNFCKESPHFSWQVEIPLDKVSGELSGHGFRVGKIKEIKIINRDGSGRISNLEVIGTDDKILICGNAFRMALGPKLIRSTNFNIRIIKDRIHFSGLGWGHGVGMCQWGAYFMAKQGKNYEQVLKYYYPGSVIQRLR